MSPEDPKGVAAILPMESAEAYEELLDQRGGAIAQRRLEELRSGEAEFVSARDVAKELGL